MTTAIADSLVLAGRNLKRITRAPDLALAFTVQPVMFLLLFVYVFGGAIQTPGLAYIDFLLPGIIVQNIAFGGFVTAIGLNEDLSKGLIDRFRSLPMARAAVLAGRTFADVVTNFVGLSILVVVGVLIGFSFNAPALDVIVGLALMVLFGYAFSWVFAWVGLTASSPEAAQSIGFIAIFPLTFASSAFVPTDSMPSWLQTFADVNPFTTTVDAMRHLWSGTPAGNDVWGAFLWAIGIIVVFAPLAVNRYRKAVTR